TAGHGERTFESHGEVDKRPGVRVVRDVLQEQGYVVKTLSAADGLATEVPQDAGVLLAIGPQQPFLPEQTLAITRYLEHGGRLFLALDPEAGLNMTDLVGPLGLDFKAQTLANDQVFARRVNQPSDRLNIVTGYYSSHPSVTTLGQLRAPIVLAG